MVISISDPSLILLIGPSGSGKSTFARRHFRSTEVLSSDFCRALVCDDECNQAATDDAFELLHLILAKRLARRRTCLVDATNVQESSRAALAEAARRSNTPLVAIVFSLPEEVCQSRNCQRAYRQVPQQIIQEQIATLSASITSLHSEGFNSIFTLQTIEDADRVTVVRENRYS